MTHNTIVKLQRDVRATQVPFGNEVILPKDTEVEITQALGGTYTAIANGQMFRIGSEDADAIGESTITFTLATEDDNSPIEDKIWNQLRTCYDPEIPVNIVDLGLIYGIDVTPTEKDQNKFNVVIHMTLTAPGCGMGPIIAGEAQQRVANLPEIEDVEIDFVFDPPWDRSMMSEQAKLELGLL